MMLEIIVFILVIVVGIQSIFMYLITKFFKNIIQFSTEEKSFKLKHDHTSLPIDLKSVPGRYENKIQKLSYFFNEKNKVSFVFLSTTCATCKNIINNHHDLPSDVYFVFNDSSQPGLEKISIISPEAFNAFDIKVTPSLITLSKDNSVKQSEIYSIDDLQLQLIENNITQKSS